MYVFPHRIAAWVLLIVAIVLAIVASTSAMWYQGNDQNHNIVPSAAGQITRKGEIGPFRSCIHASTSDTSPSVKICGTTPHILVKLSSKLKAVRGLVIVSIVAAALAVLLCGLSHAESNDGATVRGLHGASIFFGWLAGFTSAAAVGVFASMKHVSSGLKWAYILMCISSVLSFVGAIMITAPAIPVTDLAPASPAGETIASAAIAGATGVPMNHVATQHENAKAVVETKAMTKAHTDPHSHEAQALAADHAAAVDAGVAHPSGEPVTSS